MRIKGGDNPSEFIERHDLALGRMVHATIDLEYVAYMIARLVGVLEPGKRSASKALLAARFEVKAGLPPWCPAALQEPVKSWISRTLRALEQRSDHVHGVLMWRRVSDNEWRTHLRSMKEGDRFDPTEEVRYYEPLEDLDKLTAKVKTLLTEALGLVDRLSVPVGEGQSVSHPALTGTRAVPSDEYVRGWFVKVGYEQVRPEWISWPRDRYNDQLRREYLKNAPILIADPATVSGE